MNVYAVWYEDNEKNNYVELFDSKEKAKDFIYKDIIETLEELNRNGYDTSKDFNIEESDSYFTLRNKSESIIYEWNVLVKKVK